MNATLFKNVHVLDVRAGQLLEDHQVLVEDDAIRELSDRPITATTARVIDGGGRTLMPGLIDCHVHVTFSQTNLGLLAQTPQTTLALRALPILRGMLRRGFTTVRDAGGADWALKQAIDDGIDGTVTGPRLFVSGPALSPTGGHGDFRPRSDRLQPIGCGCQRLASTRVVDGVDAVRRAVRELLQMGADQIKIMSSGGEASPTDPVNALGYSLEETRAIVDEAAAPAASRPARRKSAPRATTPPWPAASSRRPTSWWCSRRSRCTRCAGRRALTTRAAPIARAMASACRGQRRARSTSRAPNPFRCWCGRRRRADSARLSAAACPWRHSPG